ncbi:hypothetical protein [Jidongwangia harbinensis]|uniref:hypothetical protein n=1 Tax=Jidongwangia harbinensis TaxID=2878561 RepID=UPI001CD95282|nr:hypothetical protein [Jidongwangia harbinensis]MCA2214101.1 hypothetical protein [Jidongwangia harbinensis]
MRIKILGAMAGTVLSLALLAGCSDEPTEKKNTDVATLQTASPTSAAPPSAEPRERPVVRPDEGKEEFERYVEVWAKCLRDEGATKDSGLKPRIRDDAKGKAAMKKCDHLYPENWMEREARTNPDYVDRLRDTAKCLKGKGHKVTVGGDPVALMYGDNTSANEAYDDEQECQRVAFKESVERYNSEKN